MAIRQRKKQNKNNQMYFTVDSVVNAKHQQWPQEQTSVGVVGDGQLNTSCCSNVYGFCLPRDFSPCLRLFLVVITGEGGASSRQRLAGNWETPNHYRQNKTKKIYRKMSVVLEKACQQMLPEDATEAM